MIFPLVSSSPRPSKADYPKKNDQYHIDMARYYISCANNPMMMRNMFTFTINYSMYAGDQWILREDLENFFMEEGGETNSRIKMRFNVIRNIVKTYINNTDRNNFQVRAYNISSGNMEQMMRELSMRMQAQQLSAAMPEFAQHFQSQFNLGANPEETEMKFYDEVSNKTDNATNAIFRMNERNYQISNWKPELAKSKCLAGFSCIKDWYRNGVQEFKIIDPSFAIYDVNSTRRDLSDGEYAGDIAFTTYAEACENNQKLRADQKRSLEDFSRIKHSPVTNTYMQIANYPTDRIPVITIAWQDTEIRKYAYTNIMGKPATIRIDNLKDGRQPDIINPNELSPEERKMVDDNGIITIEKRVPHYAEIVCKEFIQSSDDILLSSGEVPYSISKREAPFQSELPYMFDTYDFNYGRMLTPLDPAIDGQRMMNRMASSMENTINQAIGVGTVISTALVRKDGGKRNSITADMKMGRTIEVDTARTGFNLQNNMGKYSGKESIDMALGEMSIIQSVNALVQQVTSVNADMTGFNNNARQLVGVQDNNIQQGFLMQGDFVGGIAYLYYKMYWSMGNRGRRILCDNEERLIDTVGGAMSQVLQFTKNMASDQIELDFRRVPYDETAVDKVNASIIQLVQLGGLGWKQAARLFGKSEMDDVSDAIREFQQEQSAMMNDLQQEKGAQMQMQQKQQNMMLQLDQYNKSAEMQNQQMLQQSKNQNAFMRDLLKAHNKVVIEKMKQKTISMKPVQKKAS